MLMALTREISPAIRQCELTHLTRTPIDLERARAQHSAYEWALVDAGCTVRRLDTTDTMPDSVFVEDVAIVCDEIAIAARPGAETRRPETMAIALWLRNVRPMRSIAAPGTLDGGDVLIAGRNVFIGLSARTNQTGATQLREMLEPIGYRVRTVGVDGCLHLKSAVTAVGPETLLINADWVPRDAFSDFDLIDIDPAEPYAANALAIADRVIYPTAFPRTRRKLEHRGFRVIAIEMDELAKAEGAVTCCSLIFELGRP
jgi:dimethylargininase